MKSYLFSIGITLLLSGSVYAQNFTIADKVVAGEKVALIASIALQAGFKINQKDLMKRLYEPEGDFFKKRNIAANFKNAPTTAYTIYLLEEIKKNIEDARKEIDEIKKIPKVLRHGLARHESDLNKEQLYLDELKNDHGGMVGFLTDFTSGGTGYNKAADLKIMIRALEINARVKAKKNEIKNLRTLNKVIFKIK